MKRAPSKYSVAASILGQDFITPQEVATACQRIQYTLTQFGAFLDNLPSEEVLRWCKKKDYVVLPTPHYPMSTLVIREIEPASFHTKDNAWYDLQDFARDDRTSFGWLVVRKTRIPKSGTRSLMRQNKLLSLDERVPNVAEMSWLLTVCYKVRGVQLFENDCVRTSSVASDGNNVCVGYFMSNGFHITADDGNSSAQKYIGLAATRK